MSTEVLPEAHDQPEAQAASPLPTAPTDVPRRAASTRRWWRRGLAMVGVLGTLATAAAVIPLTVSPDAQSSHLTHGVTRGDLVVTVTEQGTLESANNTEIKCEVRGFSTVTWVIEGGTVVEEGDELVRLDTKVIEETVSLTKTNAHLATATLERTKADVARAEIAIDAYKEGSYRQQLMNLERNLEVAKRNLRVAEKMLDYSERLFKKGYVTELEVEGNAFTVTQAQLELKVAQTERDVLERFTQKMELETRSGNLTATKSKLEADKAGLAMDSGRRDRAEEEFANCIIRAPRAGLVIYPSAAAWKREPDITEGATVRKDQVLLLMPDLTKMQVKVGIHESVVDRVKAGQPAKVTLADRALQATVASVASVTRPAGWWTGNVVKYDTIIELPPDASLKPGMSAEVEITLVRHEDVLTIPVAAVVETAEGDLCWVQTDAGPQQRSLKLGDSNDVFIIVEAGLKEGDQVVLNPMACIDEAQAEAMKTFEEAKQEKKKLFESTEESESADAAK